MGQNCKNMVYDSRGVALIEFALILPLLLLLFVGAVELSRYVIINQKISNATHSLADYVSQVPDPENLDVSKLQKTLTELLGNYANGDTKIIVSGISREKADEPVMVQWQRSYGSAVGESNIGTQGSEAKLGDLDLKLSETLIGVELYYVHNNILKDVGFISSAVQNLDGKSLYGRNVVRYRWDAAKRAKVGIAAVVPKPTGCCGTYCQESGGNTDLDAVYNHNYCKCFGWATCDATEAKEYGCEMYPDYICNPPPPPEDPPAEPEDTPSESEESDDEPEEPHVDPPVEVEPLPDPCIKNPTACFGGG